MIKPLDYELEQSYRLVIQVRDHGENSLAQFVTIDITILDENDNTPQAFVTFVHSLINNSIISIVENTPIGQILAHVSISDQDDGLNGQMSYRIEEGQEIIGIKQIDEKSFLLIINQLIDREDEKIMNIKKFILIIFDHGKPSKSIRLEYKIHIIDLNDSPPRFNQSIKCHLDLDSTQNRSLDKPLFQIQAIDLDLNDHISYSILSPYDQSFLINNQGEIYNYNSLNQSSYHLQIMANDDEKLNSTYDCYISISSNNKLLNKSRIKMKYYYLLLFLILMTFLIIIIIGLIFYYYKFKLHKTYHLYVTIPRKSLYINDEIPSAQFNDQVYEKIFF